MSPLKSGSACAAELEKSSQVVVAPAVSDQQAAGPATETHGITPKEFKKRCNTLAKKYGSPMECRFNGDEQRASQRHGQASSRDGCRC